MVKNRRGNWYESERCKSHAAQQTCSPPHDKVVEAASPNFSSYLTPAFFFRASCLHFLASSPLSPSLSVLLIQLLLSPLPFGPTQLQCCLCSSLPPTPSSKSNRSLLSQVLQWYSVMFSDRSYAGDALSLCACLTHLLTFAFRLSEHGKRCPLVLSMSVPMHADRPALMSQSH